MKTDVQPPRSLSRAFIERPRLAAVVAIVMAFAGILAQTKMMLGDRSVVQYFVPKGTGGIGVESTVLRGAQVRIFDMERLLIETVRLRTKLPADLYHEVIGNYRRRVGELYPARIEDYLDAFPKREFLFDIIRKEVL